MTNELKSVKYKFINRDNCVPAPVARTPTAVGATAPASGRTRTTTSPAASDSRNGKSNMTVIVVTNSLVRT